MCDLPYCFSYLDLRLQAKITTIISETGVHFWVGLRYNEDTQTFEWASGAGVSYTHWSEYEPDLTHHDSQDGSCPYMHRHEDIGYWKVNELKLFSLKNNTFQVTACAEKLAFVCESPREGWTEPPPTTTAPPPPEAKCPGEEWDMNPWVKHDGHCYKGKTSKLTRYFNQTIFCSFQYMERNNRYDRVELL